MICETCKEQGLKSTISVGGSFVTCMGSSHYFDEQGAEHRHDPNETSTSYTCSNGHSWTGKEYRKCAACGWGGPPAPAASP